MTLSRASIVTMMSYVCKILSRHESPDLQIFFIIIELNNWITYLCCMRETIWRRLFGKCCDLWILEIEAKFKIVVANGLHSGYTWLNFAKPSSSCGNKNIYWLQRAFRFYLYPFLLKSKCNKILRGFSFNTYFVWNSKLPAGQKFPCFYSKNVNRRLCTT